MMIFLFGSSLECICFLVTNVVPELAATSAELLLTALTSDLITFLMV